MARRKGYGQFCPVAKAAEIVAERWNPLIVRELLLGSHRFGELRKGLPLISPSLLSQRLKELEEAGILERHDAEATNGVAYHLTAAGRQLRPIIELLGVWGHRHAQKEVSPDDLDPRLLMWDMRRGVDPTALPSDRRTVVRFDLGGVPTNKSRWWLVFDRGDVDVCLKNPGHEVDLHVRSKLSTLVDAWLGKTPIESAVRTGKVELEGPRTMIRAFPRWFGASPFVAVERAYARET